MTSTSSALPMIPQLDMAPMSRRWATPAPAQWRGAVVVAAVDVLGAPAASRSVLEAAWALRGPNGERPALHVVYAWTMVGASILSCQVRGLSRTSARDLFKRVGREHRERVLQFCDQVLPCRPAGVHVRRGDPRALIPDIARKLRADLVVLGGPSRSGLGPALVGGVAKSIIDRVPCDVLTVRGRYPW